MTTLTLNVPDSLEKDHENTVRFIAAKLYESDMLSLGQAAEMAGMKKWDFAEILGDYGINYLDASFAADLENAKSLPEVSVVITDTSCLILLQKLNALHLLNQLYSTIITTREVAKEFGEKLPSWIEVKHSDSVLTETFKENIDEGEASAIALALEINADLLITDDAKARKFAERRNLKVKGSAGVLLMAKQFGLISELKPFFNAIKNTNFRVAPSILENLLRQAGE